MALPLSFRWDEAFVARIDKARGDVSRSKWVRRAVEQALDGERAHDGASAVGANSSESERLASTPERAEHRPSPMPAEQPTEEKLRLAVKHYEPDLRELAENSPTRDEIYWRPDSPEEKLLGVRRNADSSQAKRDVRPIPKEK